MFSANTGGKAAFPWGVKQPAKAAGLTFGGGVVGGAPKQAAAAGVSIFKVTPSPTASLLGGGGGAIKPKQPWQQSLGASKPKVATAVVPTKVEVVDLDGADQPATSTPMVNKPQVSVPISAATIPSTPTTTVKSNMPIPSVPSTLVGLTTPKAEAKSTTSSATPKPSTMQPSAPNKLPSAPPSAPKPLASGLDKQIKTEASIKTEAAAPALVANADPDAGPKKKGRPKKATTHYVVGDDVPNVELKVEPAVKPEVVEANTEVVNQEEKPKVNKKKRSIDDVLGLMSGDTEPATKKKAAEPVEMVTSDEAIHTHQVAEEPVATKKLLPKKTGKRAMPLHLDEETGVAEQVGAQVEEATPTAVASPKVRKPRAPKLDEAGNPIPPKKKKVVAAVIDANPTDDKATEEPLAETRNGEVAEATIPKPRARKPKEPELDAEGNLIEPKKRATKPKEPELDADGNPIEPKKRATKPKEPELDADGNPIPAAPKKRATKPKEPELDAEGNPIPAAPKKRATKPKEPELDAEGNPIPAAPKKRGRKPKEADNAVNDENKMDVTSNEMEVDVVEPVVAAAPVATIPKAKKTAVPKATGESTAVVPKAPRKRAPAKPKPNAITIENITYGEDGRPRVHIPLNETDEENLDIFDDGFDISRRLDESFGESDFEEDEEDDEIDEDDSDDDDEVESEDEDDDLVIVNEDEYGNEVAAEIVIDDDEDAGEEDEDDEDRNFLTKKVEKVDKPIPISRTKIGEKIYKDSLFKGGGDLDVTNIVSGKRQRYRPYNDYLDVDKVLKDILPASVVAEDDSRPIDLKAEDEIHEFDDLTPAQKRRVNQLTGKKSEPRPKKAAAAVSKPVEVDLIEAEEVPVATTIDVEDEVEDDDEQSPQTNA